MSAITSPRARRIGSGALAILTCISLLVTVLAISAGRTVLDTDRFTAAVERSLQSPEVLDALSGWVTGEVEKIITQSDVAERLLPDQLDAAAPILERLITDTIVEQVDRALRSDRARTLVVTATEYAHEAALRILEGDIPTSRLVVVEDGIVSLNLLPVIGGVLGRIQDRGLLDDIDLPKLSPDMTPAEQNEALSDALGVDLPEDLGQFVVYESSVDRDTSVLGMAQRGLQMFRTSLVLLALITLLLGALTIVVAPDRRRMALWLAGGVAATSVVALLVIRRVADAVPQLVTDPESRDAVEQIVHELLAGLDDAVTLLGVLALLLLVALVAAAWLGRRPDLTARGTALVHAHPDAARTVVVVLAIVVLVVGGLHVLPLILSLGIAVGGLAWIARFDPRDVDPQSEPTVERDVERDDEV